jgi:hypothetical protein
LVEEVKKRVKQKKNLKLNKIIQAYMRRMKAIAERRDSIYTYQLARLFRSPLPYYQEENPLCEAISLHGRWVRSETKTF